MFNRILVPLDGSEFAEKALAPAFHLAEANGARVTLLAVVSRLEADALHTETLDDRWHERGEAYLRKVQSRLGRHTFPIDLHIELGLPADHIVQFAQENHIDLIVMSTHGGGADHGYPLGSTAWKVLQRAPCPVLMVQARPEPAGRAA